MPTTYENAPQEVLQMARELLSQYETHQPLLDHGVTIQYQMAFAERDDDTGQANGPSIKWHGRPALGLCEIINEKNRASGLKDARITICGDTWPDLSVAQQKALLDHELHHLAVIINRHGVLKVDGHGRPCLRLRKHDVEIGHFVVIAERHGMNSQECIQMKTIYDAHGQAFWPDMVGESTEKADGRFARILKEHGATVSIHTSKS
jgi:hypothetical protein